MIGKADEEAKKVRVGRTRTLLLLETKVGQAAVPEKGIVDQTWHGTGGPDVRMRA